jgi:hypothetical protein
MSQETSTSLVDLLKTLYALVFESYPSKKPSTAFGANLDFLPLLTRIKHYHFVMACREKRTVGVSTRGVPGPTSKLSLRVPAQMGRRETEHKGETIRGTAARVVLCPGRMRLQ